jgi:hypothetical protein
MQLIKTIVIAVSILIPTSLIAASPDGPPREWSDRHATLLYLKAVFDKLDSDLPTLSPSEQKWIESERAAMSADTRNVKPGVPFTLSSRSEKYLASSEYHLARVRDAVAEIRKVLGFVEWAQREGASNAEVYYWVGLMRELDDGDTISDDLSSLRKRSTIHVPPDVGITWMGDGAAHVDWRFWGAAIWGGFLEKATLQLAKDADRN